MSDEQKKQLQTQLWNIANELRGKMDADEFRDYILGFIFYKYLSEKMHLYANEILEADKLDYKDVQENTEEGKKIVEAIKKEAIDKLGYFLKPSELFHSLVESSQANNNIIEKLEKILNGIEHSTMGTDSEEDFDKLFSELDLNASQLGKTVQARSELIGKVLTHLDKIDFHLGDSKIDVLGDAYEYLIAQFASGAGKKAGEFYTPQEVSEVLAKLVTLGKKHLKNVYDPTCGSGSLLLRVARYVDDVGFFYGQELNNTTYNLARMNMILHDIRYDRFDLRQEDTLEHPQHLEARFEAVVANPPFSAKWSANPLFMNDDRFSQYGKLPPKAYADYAFIQHMIYQLDDNGTMATVMSLGVLFREGAEESIRKYIIKEKNYLDAVIVLPPKLFYGTPVPACILIFKKCRENPNDIFFINATGGFKKLKNRNVLREEDIDRIYKTYKTRSEDKGYGRRVPMEEIVHNNYNLNLSRYIDIFEKETRIDIEAINFAMNTFKQEIDDVSNKINKYCKELNIISPEGSNIELLKKFKKGMMQKLFSGRLRFLNKGDNYNKWQKDHIANVFYPEKGSGLSKDDIWEKGKYKCILYGELYTTYSEIIDAIKSRTDIEVKIRSMAGDLLIPCSTTTEAIDLANVSLINEAGVLLGGDITVLRFKEVGCGAFYAYYLTHYKKFDIAKYAQGSTIIHLYYKHFKEVVIDIPEIDEQKKIADFLILIDTKIKLIEDNLEQAKLFKKSLLQRMFV